MTVSFWSLPRRIELIAGLVLGVLILLSLLGRDMSASDDASEKMQIAALASLAVPPARPRVPEPVLNAEAYFVRFADDPAPLLTRRAEKSLPPASLTKIMTVFAARQILAPDDVVLFSEEAKAVEEAKSDVSSGETFMRDDAVRLAMIPSVNDAALALAGAAGREAGEGDFANRIAFFVRFMNEQARVMGMRDTHFENPTGLDAPDHAASARDLAELAASVLARDPEIFTMSRDLKADIFSTDGKRHTIENTNDLLKEFPALVGGKTGMTDNAKGALILLYPVGIKSPEAAADAPVAHRASRGAYPAPPQRTIIIVLMKSDDRFGDGRKTIRWLEESF